MPRLKRFNVKAMLASPDLRRKLIVDGTRAAQAREGVDVSTKEAENSYYVVTEAERAAFFNLIPFRGQSGENDGRHIEFINTLANLASTTRSDVAHRDFDAIDDAPLAYDKIGLLGHMFRDYPSLSPAYCDAKQGLISTESERFVRLWWEPSISSPRRWVSYAKGGDFSRFYSDIALRFDWTDNGAEIKAIAKERYGSASRTIKCEEYYFRPGITWVEKTIKGMNARVLPEGAIFNVAGPSAFPHNRNDTNYLLGLLNSTLCQAFLNCFATRSWGVEYVGRVPTPKPVGEASKVISDISRQLHLAKQEWDSGNEICTHFDRPWILKTAMSDKSSRLSTALDGVMAREAALDDQLGSSYAELNDAVYRLYGVNEVLRSKIEAAIGPRPPEIVWPQMEGKSVEQKRLEHVNRLLTYLMKRLVEADNDGLVCLQAVAQERPLLDRLREELHRSFPQQDPSILETEVVNELKKKVKGYRRAETLNEWLNDAFFEIHANLYQQRPLLWHLASSQTRSVPAFSVVVHAHKFDGDALAKLRSVHIRDRLAILRREAGQARQDKREEDRLEFLAAIEEVEAFDAKLKLLQEGAHTGPEGGDRDYRILTPWKAESDRPQGWNPDLDDGIKVNIAPLARTGLLRIKGRFGEKDVED